MEIINLASGSKGNCTIIRNDNTTIMLDCGISNRQINQRLNDLGIKINNYDALLITHEHGDHVGSLNSVYKHNNLKLYMNYESFKACNNRITSGIDIDEVIDIHSEENFYIKDILVTPLLLSHDVKNCFGYIFTDGDKKVVYITDTGYVIKKYYPLIKNASVYMLESNHDPELLLYSTRPYVLKQRIMGTTGHLSNEDACNILNDLYGENTEYIMLMHLSRECNSEQICLDTYNGHFKYKDQVKIFLARQDKSIGIINV